MKKRFIVWAIFALTAGLVSAQETVNKEDSVIVREMELGEVVVSRSRVIRKDDRRLFLPDREQTRTATDGMDLLRKMQLPHISVNQLTGEISMTGGGKVRLCLNGVQVGGSELAAVRPEDIIRIEYHDAPGARYDGADAVIDYITWRHDAGGSVSGETMDALGSGKWASIDQLSAQYNSGRSSWMLTAGYMGQRRNNWVRDYDETWRYPDHEVSRREVGQPVSIGGDMLQGSLGYSIAGKGKYFFSARLSLDYNHVPAKEEGDRHTVLYTSEQNSPIEIYEHTNEHSVSPSLDLYFSSPLGNGRQVIFDVVGTYIGTGSRRVYRENDVSFLEAERVGAEIVSDVSGDKYSLIAEGIYEQTIGGGRLSAGMRCTQAYTDNRYRGTDMAAVSMRHTEGAAFAEYAYRNAVWGVAGSVTARYIRYAQDCYRIRQFAVQPSVRFTFQPADRLQLRYNANLSTETPSLADMSDVVQEVQTGMVRRGNPLLRPFRVFNQKFAAGYSGGMLSVDLTAGYRHEFNPIMETVMYDDGMFVRTYDNQRSFRRIDVEMAVTLRPWRDHLSLSVTPIIYRYFSRGNDYSHCHTIKRLKVDADLSYSNWLLSYTTMMGPANTMYGEESLEEKNMNIILIGYRRPQWTIQAGVFNAFMREYWMETRNANALTPFTSRAHCSRNTYFTVKLNFNLSYGRQTQHHERKINNEDRDAGIMKRTK